MKHINKLLSVLIQNIENKWDSNKIHVLPHSSGYDSRLMSCAIKSLAKKNGTDWMGETYFICFQPEIKQFLDIMRYEGWLENHIITIKPDAPQLDYHAEGMKFENMMKIKYPHRFICRCFDFLLNREIDRLGGDIQLISGMWSDEVMEYKSRWNTVEELRNMIKTDIHFDNSHCAMGDPDYLRY